MFKAMLTNAWTTLTGAFIATLNQTVEGPGFHIPSNKQEAMVTLKSFAILFFGLVMKDATTGSKPGGK